MIPTLPHFEDLLDEDIEETKDNVTSSEEKPSDASKNVTDKTKQDPRDPQNLLSNFEKINLNAGPAMPEVPMIGSTAAVLGQKSLPTVDGMQPLRTLPENETYAGRGMTTSDSPLVDLDGELPYVALFSPHGLIRGKSPELGRDLDTGGQVSYVLELARALGKYAQVDLFTRLVDDVDCEESYAAPEEKLADRVFLVRIECGPRKYVRKEMLWPFFDEYCDRVQEFILNRRKRPSILHGHYADGGIIAAKLADIFGCPMALTGHSMGRTKLKTLMKQMPYMKIKNQYKIDIRCEAEERSLLTTNLVIANSREEINTQWRLLYDGFRSLESLWIPIALKPGVGMKRFIWRHNEESQSIGPIDPFDMAKMPLPSDSFREKSYPKIWKVIDRFLDDPDKPVVLLLARPAPEKNLISMIEAFGESQVLQDTCNLVIIAGQRKDIAKMPTDQREVLENILKLIDKYDLYGKVAYPKAHQRADVPAMFSLPAHRRGVFANIALREPFGLTMVEAAINGCPILATRNGAGPEIVDHLHNGLTVDPIDIKGIQDAILKIVNDHELWQFYHTNSLKYAGMYSWDGHVERYSQLVRSINEEMAQTAPPSVFETRDKSFRINLGKDDVLVVSDIDNTLLGPTEEAREAFRKFVATVRANKHIKLAISTGRSINSAIEYLNQHDPRLVMELEFLITSVGAEIHYIDKKTMRAANGTEFQMKTLHSDSFYHQHLSYRFLDMREEIRYFIDDHFPEMEFQSEASGHSPLEQRLYKLSYCITTDKVKANKEEKGFSFEATKRLHDSRPNRLNTGIGRPKMRNRNSADTDEEPTTPRTPRVKVAKKWPTVKTDADAVDSHALFRSGDSDKSDNAKSTTGDGAEADDDEESYLSTDTDGEDDAERLSLRAPSMASLQSFDSTYSLRPVGSTMHLHHLGIQGSMGSTNSLASLGSFSQLRTPGAASGFGYSSGGSDRGSTGKLSSLATTHEGSTLPATGPPPGGLPTSGPPVGSLNIGAVKPARSRAQKLVSKSQMENSALNKVLYCELEHELRGALRKQGYVCEVIVSHDKFVDIIPIRASKGKAIRHLMARNNLSFEKVFTAGDSGNDRNMLTGMLRAIVVGNHSHELKTLRRDKFVHFSEATYANGILEGLQHYGVI